MTYDYYEHQNIKVELMDKEHDNLIRVSKQDNHFMLDKEMLPVVLDFLEYATISSLSVVEMCQTKDYLKKIESGNFK